jgi:hypothetical protein
VVHGTATIEAHLSNVGSSLLNRTGDEVNKEKQKADLKCRLARGFELLINPGLRFISFPSLRLMPLPDVPGIPFVERSATDAENQMFNVSTLHFWMCNCESEAYPDS